MDQKSISLSQFVNLFDQFKSCSISLLNRRMSLKFFSISLESHQISFYGLFNRCMSLISKSQFINQFNKSVDQFPLSVELFDKSSSFFNQNIVLLLVPFSFHLTIMFLISLTWRIALVSKTSQKQLQGWSLKVVFIKKEIRTCVEACTTIVSWTILGFFDWL